MVEYGSPVLEDTSQNSVDIKYGNPVLSDVPQGFTQGENENILNRLVNNIRKFLHIDAHQSDYPNLVAIEKYGSATDENVNKVYKDIGLSPNYLNEVSSNFWNQASLGIVPVDSQPEPESGVGKAALATVDSISSLAGFIAADSEIFGGLNLVSDVFKGTSKIARFGEKLNILRRYAPTLAAMRPRSALLADMIGGAARLSLDSAVVNMVQSNERTNNIFKAIKDIEPDVLQSSLFGAGIPLLSKPSSLLFKGILSLAIGNTASYISTGKTTFSSLIEGLKKSDPKEISDSLFNTFLDVFFAYSAHHNMENEPPTLDESKKAVEEIVGNIDKYIKGFEGKYDNLRSINDIKDEIKMELNNIGVKADEIDKRISDYSNNIVNLDENGKIVENADEDKNITIVSAVKEPEVIQREEQPIKGAINHIEKESEAVNITKPSINTEVEQPQINDIGKNDIQYPTFEQHLVETKPEIVKNVVSLAKEDLSQWKGYKKTKSGLDIKEGAKPQWLKGTKKDALKTLKSIENGNVDGENEKQLLNDIIDYYGSNKENNIPARQELYNEYHEKYKDSIDQYFEQQKQKYGEDTPYMFGGIPFKKGIDDFAKAVEKNTLPMKDKTLNPFTYLLVNPNLMDSFGTKESKAIFKYIKHATFEVEKLTEKFRTPLIDVSDETASILKTLNKKTDKYNSKQLLSDIKKAIVEGDRKQEDPKTIFRDINKQNIDKEMLDMVDKLIDKHQEFYTIGRKNIMKFIDSQLESLKDVVNDDIIKKYKEVVYPELQELKYYMPRTREPGNVRVRIYDKNGKEIFMTHVTDLTVQPTKIVSKNGVPRSFMAKRAVDKFFKEHPEIKRNETKIKTEFIKPDMDISKFDMFDMLDFIDDVLTKTDISEKEKSQAITDAINKIRSKGFMSHSIKRKDEIVYGYNEDPFDVMGKYIAQSTAFIQKQAMKGHLAEAYKQAQKIDDPLLHRYLRTYKEEVLRNKDWLDTVINQTRKWLFIKYLGLSLKNGFINVTFQIPVVTAMHTSVELARGAKATPVHFAQAEKLMAQVSKDLIKKNLTDREKNIMDYLDRLGVTKDQKTQYMLGKSALLTGSWNKMMDATGIIMRITEEANRKVSALAYIRLHPEMTDDQLVEGARNFVYTTNGKYGDTELSIVFQGKGSAARIGRIGQTFATYVHQTILGAVKLMKEGQGTAVLMGVGMLMFMGGLASTPFFGTIQNVYQDLTGRDLNLDIQKELGNSAYLYKWLKGGLFANLPFGLGVDISSSAGINLPTDELNYMGKDVSDKVMNIVFGVGYSAAKDIFKSIDYFAKGDINKGIEYGVPARFLTYPIKALDEYYRGLTTTGDLILVDPQTGKPFKTSAKEALLQSVGFTPERVSEFKNLYYTWKNLRLYWTNRKTVLYNKARVAIEKGDKKKYISALKEMMELNRKMIKESQDYNLGLTPANVQSLRTVSSNRAFRNFYLSNAGVR